MLGLVFHNPTSSAISHHSSAIITLLFYILDDDVTVEFWKGDAIFTFDVYGRTVGKKII